MNQDIEQRAEDWTENKLIQSNHMYDEQSCKEAFIAAMTEERERGKRFAKWLGCYNYNDKYFEMFLEEEQEKALNN